MPKKMVVQEEYNNLNAKKMEVQEEYSELHVQFEKFKFIFGQKRSARTRRENTPTTFENINDNSNSTRYKRQKETKDVLQYIHGGSEGAIYGAWDFLKRHASNELIEKLLLSYKRGKFLEKIYGKFTNVLEKGDIGLKKALAKKYYAYLSRRKYNFMCRVQKSMFDPLTETWSANTI